MFMKRFLPLVYGGGAARRRLGRNGRSEEAHEGGELLRAAHGLDGRGGVGVCGVVGYGGELAARRLLTLLGKELVGDALLDVVRLAREDQERLVLCLPAEARDGAVVAARVGRAGDLDAIGAAADAESGLAVGGRGEVVRQLQCQLEHGVRASTYPRLLGQRDGGNVRRETKRKAGRQRVGSTIEAGT